MVIWGILKVLKQQIQKKNHNHKAPENNGIGGQ